MNDLVKVVVVDDHTLVRYGLTGLVDQEPDLEIVGDTGHRTEAVGMVLSARPNAQALLSPRETQVLELLGQGLSVRAIAVALSVSVSTAKTYVARLYEKLEVSNRAQAIMTALQRGLIAPKS